MAITAAAVKAALAALTDEQARKTVGWIAAAVLAPIILIAALLLSLLSGTTQHNNAAVDLQYLDRPKDAQVIGLTAPLGVESGLVQYYVIASLALYAGLYMGGESGQKWVLFVELFHGHVLSLYFLYHSTLGVERQIGKMFRLRI